MADTELAKLLQLQMAPKEEPAAVPSQNEMLAQAILGLAPILAGAAFGGAKGGAIGAEAGLGGLSYLEKAKKEKADAEKAGLEKTLALAKEKRAEEAALRAEERQAAELGISKQRLALERQKAEKGEVTKPSKLTSEQTSHLSSIDSATFQLGKIAEEVDALGDKMGPIAGFKALSPYATESKAFDARMKLAAQDIGKSLEGGKLTDQDILRYRQMLPNLSDTPELAKQKIAIINELLSQKKAATIDVLGKSGYDVSRLPAPEVIAAPVVFKKKEQPMTLGTTDAQAGAPTERQLRIQELRKQLGK